MDQSAGWSELDTARLREIGYSPRGRTDLAGRDLIESMLYGLDFSGADLTETMLGGAILWDSVLSGARCVRTDFYKAEMHRVVAHGADFSGGRFLRTEMYESDFAGSRFDGAYVFGEAVNTSFAGATFVGSVLDQMSFHGSDLTGAVFDGAIGNVMRPWPTARHPSWGDTDLVELLRKRGADVEYFVTRDAANSLYRNWSHCWERWVLCGPDEGSQS